MLFISLLFAFSDIMSEVAKHVISVLHVIFMRNSFTDIDVGTGGGHWGCGPQDFAINKEVPFLF